MALPVMDPQSPMCHTRSGVVARSERELCPTKTSKSLLRLRLNLSACFGIGKIRFRIAMRWKKEEGETLLP